MAKEARLPPRRVAVVHDWLTSHGGAERVLGEILRIYPEAELFAVCDFLDGDQRGFLGGREVTTSFIQRLPGARRKYRYYLPLMPLAVEQLDMRGFDLVLSSSHAVAKGVITGPEQLHVAYVHSPMRYAWDLQHDYLERVGLTSGIRSMVVRWMLHRIRMWDVRTVAGVDKYVANSMYIRRRIQKIYGRPAEVVYPPVDVDYFTPSETARKEYYVTVSRLVPYKRVDLIIRAFNSTPSRELVIIGDGPERRYLKRLAKSNVRMLGVVPPGTLRRYVSEAKAFVFAAEEDFGIAPLESQSSGTPVIAYGHGGTRETVLDGVTGVLFGEQTADALLGALQQFESARRNWDPVQIREHAMSFSASRFRGEFRRVIEEAWSEFSGSLGQPDKRPPGVEQPLGS